MIYRRTEPNRRVRAARTLILPGLLLVAVVGGAADRVVLGEYFTNVF